MTATGVATNQPGGWTCQACGQWIAANSFHVCMNPQPAAFYPVFWQTQDAAVLAELKAIRELLEKLVNQREEPPCR